ncbi:MAG: hypothetical protein KGZ30_01945 [Anaplasmataceae bacterium]|nr:hypothetical protein [Anaplasmataceae bacterium]
MTIFSSKVLRSELSLEAFLYSRNAIQSIKSQAKKPYIPGESRMGTWTATWIACTAYNRILFSLFLDAIGHLVHLFDTKKACQFFIRASHTEFYAYAWCAKAIHGDHLLVNTLNCPALNTEDIYAHAPISIDSLSKSMQDRLHFYITNSQLCLQRSMRRGQCYGMSELFAHLYFQTRASFNNEEHHLTTVAKIFAQGAPREAVLWQHVQHNNEKKPLLHLKKNLVANVINPTVEKVKKTFQLLKNRGIYAIRIISTSGKENHRINFIQEKQHSYYFDSNKGLVSTASSEELDALYNRIAQSAQLYIYRMTQKT